MNTNKDCEDELAIERRIVEGCNTLARRFYKMQDCVVPDDFKFYKAHHPAEVACWNMAVEAYSFIEGTDVEDCLSVIEDEEEE